MSKIANRHEFPKGTRVSWLRTTGERETGTIHRNDDEYAAQIEPDDKSEIRGLFLWLGWEFVLKVCRYCGKSSDQDHTAETMNVHADLHARKGSSFMCESPSRNPAERKTVARTLSFDEWYANTDFPDFDRDVRNDPTVYQLYEESMKIDTSKFVVRAPHRVIFVTKANIGPCGHKDESGEYCRRPVAVVMYHNGDNENGGRYDKTVHADDGTGHGFLNDCRVIPACPKCKTEDSLTTQQQAYGDLTTCTVEGCNYSHWYDIGD
ncbi:hypothetical protein AB0K16_22160 [Nonomuraea jabiensis]|uniref:hypothetical protein n=1 Tax=Nonomuraea jabiensis TaxID=882448 RepID=UPI0034153B54